MSGKDNGNVKQPPPEKPPIKEHAGDGFPSEKDVSTPPPESDVLSGTHKKKD